MELQRRCYRILRCACRGRCGVDSWFCWCGEGAAVLAVRWPLSWARMPLLFLVDAGSWCSRRAVSPAVSWPLLTPWAMRSCWLSLRWLMVGLAWWCWPGQRRGERASAAERLVVSCPDSCVDSAPALIVPPALTDGIDTRLEEVLRGVAEVYFFGRARLRVGVRVCARRVQPAGSTSGAVRTWRPGRSTEG